jgi:hypothetical protein
MRLQLITVIGVLLATGTAHAQSVADAERAWNSGLRVYADDDHVTVISPSAGAIVPIGDSLVTDLALTVDVVSAASVDVLTQASPDDIDEKRVEVDTGVAYAVSSTLGVRGRAIISHESDYDALRLTGGGRIELAERNTTLDLAYTLALDSIGSAVDDSFDESRTGHQVTASFTQILDARTYVDVVVDAQRFDGYHANPYREVPIVDPSTTALMSVPETTPELRTSVAGLLRVRRAFETPRRWFASAYYRAYADDWDIVSHTGYVHAIIPVASDRVQLGLQGRYYWQGAADFYQASYVGDVPDYRTRDRTLGGMSTVHGAVTVGVGWFVGSLGAARFSFRDYPAQSGRNAVIISTGAVVPF